MNRQRFSNLLGVACVAIVLLAAVGPAVAYDTSGFIYGKITTGRGTTYEGRIRWADEEASWGDFFNSSKVGREYYNEIPKRERRESIKIFGISIGSKWYDDDRSRAFKARFGDIDRIEIDGGDDAVVVMKSGTEYEIEGGSNDIGAKINIWDPAIGKIELNWNKIETIDFMAAPSDLSVDVRRLFGTVQTRVGEFRGFIQWDQHECLSADKLDGDSEDGSLSLEMGRLKSIERRSRSSSEVVLKDGRTFVLDGSNDVDSDNRGVYVDDERYGRVLISWSAFERIDFSDTSGSGPAYTDFAAGKPLRGTVTERGGETRRGQVVFDVDEAESWEILDGDWRDVSYSIPMSMVKTVAPRSSDSSRVTLRNGEKLDLEDSADVGDSNSGILMIDGEGEHHYVAWEDVDRVDFD